MEKLPPMPKPALDLLWHDGAYYVRQPSAGTVAYFTLSQLQADRLAVWNAALEAAAKACEDQALIHHEREGAYDAGKKAGAFGCASAIRLLEETN